MNSQENDPNDIEEFNHLLEAACGYEAPAQTWVKLVRHEAVRRIVWLVWTLMPDQTCCPINSTLRGKAVR